jgi:hypothetical protein
VTIRLSGSAASTAALASRRNSGLSLPVRISVGARKSAKRVGSNAYSSAASISRGRVCAAFTRAGQAGKAR